MRPISPSSSSSLLSSPYCHLASVSQLLSSYLLALPPPPPPLPLQSSHRNLKAGPADLKVGRGQSITSTPPSSPSSLLPNTTTAATPSASTGKPTPVTLVAARSLHKAANAIPRSSSCDLPLKTSVGATAITTCSTAPAVSSLASGNVSCQSRRYASSLSSVTGLTQELLRITAFRNSTTSVRSVPLAMAPPPTADHLVVLVHGLWGNPNHMEYLAKTLKSRYNDSKLIVHVASKNAGNHTYDGIELGGERLAHEIEELLEDLSGKGVIIKKFSITGYSLGGLVSRYVVGVLHAKGFFDKIQPVNFTTFASPHLGVRTPKLGFHNHIWNVVGARTLSASGRQLFTIDKFRDTERPLLAILADKELVFWKALSMFKNRVLYANIINDRSVTFFTAGISKSDPFSDLDMVDYKYVPGYGDVLIDDEAGFALRPEIGEDGKLIERKGRTIRDFVRDLPFLALYTFLIPIGFCFFLANAGIQTFTSTRRIKLHDPKLQFDIPLMANEVQETMDSVIDSINHAQSPDHLPASGDTEGAHSPSAFNSSPRQFKPGQTSLTPTASDVSPQSTPGGGDDDESKLKLEKSLSMPEFPTLALAPYQFDMIDALDQLNFKKFPVHIHKVKHSHAAIIVRNPSNENFSEGKIVIKHWLDGQFEV